MVTWWKTDYIKGPWKAVLMSFSFVANREKLKDYTEKDLRAVTMNDQQWGLGKSSDKLWEQPRMSVVDKAMGHEKYKYQVIYDVHLVIVPFLFMAWNILKAHFRLIWIPSASLVIRPLLKYKIKITLLPVFPVL